MKSSFSICFASLLMPAWLYADTKAPKGTPAPKADTDRYSLEEYAKKSARSRVDELKYDINGNNRIEPSEAAAWIADVNNRAQKAEERQVDSFREGAADVGLSPSGSYTPKEWAPLMPPEDPPKVKVPEHFRMRGSVEDFAKGYNKKSNTMSEAAIRKLNPAIFSYGRDFLADTDTWTAKGAVGGFWGDQGWAQISAGVEFDRVETDNPGEADADSLVFKALLNNSKTVSTTGPLHSVEWSFGPTYATNFDFAGGLAGGSGEMELLWRPHIFRSYANIWEGGPSVTLRHFIHAEGGGTVDDFPGAAAPADDEYLRLGSRLEAVIWPAGYNVNPRIKFRTGYGYYAEVLGEGPDWHNFYGAADIQLDDDGHFTLTIEYNNGLVPMSLTDRETLLISLGVRF